MPYYLIGGKARGLPKVVILDFKEGRERDSFEITKTEDCSPISERSLKTRLDEKDNDIVVE